MARLCKDGYLIQSLRNSDFDCYSAYGEVIDNSLQADAKNISIEFDCVSRGTGRNQKEIISKIHSDTERLGNTVILPFINLISNFLIALIIIFAVFLVDFKVALISISIFSLFYFFFLLFF